jgi:hypothetical protein
MKLPLINLGNFKVSRLILGGNPISGFSHISPEKDKEMIDYYTYGNIKSVLDECMKYGINTIQARGDRHIMRLLNEYRNEGKDMQWIAQTASELKEIKPNLAAIVSNGAIAIYHHGTYIDNLWHTGASGIKRVEEDIKMIKDTGLFTGFGTHRPEVVDYAEEKGWDFDFYVVSFYNLAKKVKPVQATEGFKEENFDDNDPGLMVNRIKATKKPCLAIKILGGGRKAGRKEDLENAFKFAFDNIKPIDGVIVGMFQKYKNQVKENAEIVRMILS